MEKPPSFESAYGRLEEILEKMNRGSVPLEDSLALYEEADTLLQYCTKTLDKAEKKIQILIKNREGALVQDSDGKVKTEPFNVDEE
ncbi:MAG: exodeoxyribonuclease VII small subunit [Verrucomicrobia bacterium]|jgi:exodeoxyribonuclease VII small subunit|nr:exodeoxyribonuclease VII small subunit [Verrucomicrobiota bacterium]